MWHEYQYETRIEPSKKLLSTASILALALTLSACGSNSNDNSDAPAPTDPVETPTDPAEVLNELTTLSGDEDSPGSALMKATEAAEKITLFGSNGDSNAAMMSAQTVLDARTELEDAKSSAEKVLEDLPDTPENAAERDMLETAIAAAEDVLDGYLKAEIVKVTGTDEEEPETPEDRGREVAEKVLATFANGVNAEGGVIIARTVPPSHDVWDIQPGNDHSAVTGMISSGGQTFGEIFSSDVTERPLGAEGALVPTISIAGEINYGIDPAETATKFPLGGRIENSWVGSTDVAKGIGGFFQCMGAGCEIEDGKLVGPWVFAPGDYSPKIAPPHYVAMEDGEGYTKVQHVWYGHWLRAINDDDVRLYATARLDNNDADQAKFDNWKAIEGEDASATYSGNTVGRSVRHEFATDGKVAATHSGSFTADVDFTATFGDSPMLEGKVSGFSAVDNVKAVNTGWEVTLEDGSISGIGGPAEAWFKGVSKGGREFPAQDQSRRAEEWWALGYLDEGVAPNPGSGHPDGIYGGFHADFTDGQAAGAFATRKDN